MNKTTKNQKAHLFYALFQKIPIAMRITLLLLFVLTFQLQAEHIYSQDAKISLDMRNSTIEKVLQTIEEKSDYYFLYNNRLINVDRKVSVRVRNAAISAVLERLFKSENVDYEVKGTQIILSPKEMHNQITAVAEAVQQQKKAITGTIVDAAGVPIIGANIVEIGTTNGTITDVDGKFLLNVENNAIIHISYIGYLEQDINTSGKASFNITLLEDTQALEEVVVVGYGTQRKRDIAGSVSSVSSTDLSIQSVTNMQNLLQGRLSGVSVATSGVPGTSPVIRIRGIGTLGDNAPLYIIDGFPTKSDLAAQINPSNIESVQVIKDAATASIYGARAANGVILITTKQGKAGKTDFNVKVNMGVQTPTNMPEVLNTQQYGEVLWNAMKNAGLTPSHAQYGNGPTPVIPDFILPSGASEGQVDLSTYNTAENQYMRANKIGTNWFDEVYRLAKTMSVDLSAQGGGENSKYFTSANYTSQDAIIKWAGYDRLSFRGNSQFTILPNVIFGTNMSATYSKYLGGTSDQSATYQTPIIPVYDVMGNWAGSKANGLGDAQNPVASLYNQKDNENEYLNFLGNIFLEINFLESFQFRSTAGANSVNQSTKYFSPKTFWNKGDKNTLVNGLSENSNKTMELVWSNTLTYTKNINDNHNIVILIGTEALTSSYKSLMAARNTFLIEDTDYRYLNAGETNKDNSGSGSEYSLFSIFSRINYQYKDKYYVSAIIRRDGSSRFGANNKYGYFPGISTAWRISEEAFMDNKDIISDVKLRASYGLTGNSEIGNYAFASIYGTNIQGASYPIAGDPNSVTQGISKEAWGNPNVKWETTTQTNLGLDVGLFDNSLFFNFDWYRKYTSDILQRPSYPGTGGVASTPYENVGEILNNGLEFGLNFRNTAEKKDFTYDIGLILSGYRNEVKKLANNQFISDTYNRTEVGYPIGSFYGYTIDGIFQDQQQVDNHAQQTAKAIGRWIYRDANGDGVINDNDRTFIGNPHPKFEYSLNSRLYYKNFDFNIFIQGVYGNKIAFASKAGQSSIDFWGDYTNKSVRILDTWTVNNRDAKLPEINILNPNGESTKVSTYLLEDGSYLRVKNMELGYTLPSTILSKINVKHCRVFLNTENILTISKYNSVNNDPEVTSTDRTKGVDDINRLALAKIYSIGFNFMF